MTGTLYNFGTVSFEILMTMVASILTLCEKHFTLSLPSLQKRQHAFYCSSVVFKQS